MKSARQTAFDILLKIEKDGAYSNLSIDGVLSGCALSSKDKAFVCALIYGCIERKITLDYQFSLYLDKPLNKLKVPVLTVLRMGAYQLLFMDKVPVNAAVNESVKLVKSVGATHAHGLVNAVLRKIAQNGLLLPDSGDETDILSVKYSCPKHLISMWTKAYGRENTVSLLEESLKTTEIVIRVNTLKTTAEKLIEVLSSYGIQARQSDRLPNALVIEKLGTDIQCLPPFKEGLFHVQDLASQYCAMALDAKNGELVYDLCSAPGGKAFTIAQYMKGEGEIFAFDVYKARVDLISQGAKRLGISCIAATVGDASSYDEKLLLADRVLCDVPCSGLGVIRRKPEIKYKQLDEFKQLPLLQYKILCNAASYVKPSGRLVYSTCALNPKENEKVCDMFLLEHEDFTCIQPLEIDTFGDRYYTLMPHKNATDGFFIAVFQKKGEAK